MISVYIDYKKNARLTVDAGGYCASYTLDSESTDIVSSIIWDLQYRELVIVRPSLVELGWVAEVVK